MSGNSGVTRFLYDGDALVAEYDQSGNMLKRYVHGEGADTPLVWFEGAGTSAADRRYLFTDHQGSVTAITNGDGNTIAINRYDEYGIPSSTNTGRFQYTGQMWIPELGMYHYKTRVYSPTLGRFLQTDPIGYADGLNWYNYVGGDPVNRRDPTGMTAEPIVVTASPLEPGLGFLQLVMRDWDSLLDRMRMNGEIVVTAIKPQNGDDAEIIFTAFGTCKPSPFVTCTNPVSPSVYQNIINKHLINARPGKSKFQNWALNPIEFSLAVGKVLEGPYKTVAPGIRTYTQNLGFNVGTDRYTGRPTGLMTVWVQNRSSTDGFWSVANAYPGPQ